MLTCIKLKSLKPRDKSYKVTDREGLYAQVSPTGNFTFRLDYCYIVRRETLTFGRYGLAASPWRKPVIRPTRSASSFVTVFPRLGKGCFQAAQTVELQ
ncbi:MAG: Arm DNA-binding domain-containing protein [Burkholderiales bacterium]